jgi:phosphatidylinositol alpha-1,6-mannosyltransferase
LAGLRLMLLGIFPELSSVGGIQQVSRHSGAVLAELARAHGEPCRLLGLNDPAGAQMFQVGDRRYEFRGFARRKVRLAAAVLALAPKVRLVYIGHANLAPLGLALRLFHPRAKYWVAAHGIEVWERLPGLRRLALRRASRVAAVSAFTARAACQAQRLDPKKCFVLPPALDPIFAGPRESTSAVALPDQARVLLAVGRLIAAEPGKGVDTAIQALPKVLRAIPDACLLIVGDGDARPSLEKLTRETGVADHVVFAGEQPVEALRGFYDRCEVFVMPSRQEGFGVVFLEAMAHGKPVIAGAHGGTPELVEDGVSGYLVRYGDAETTANRLLALLEDPALSARMGAAGRARFEQNHTFERYRERLTEMLEKGLS